MLRYLTAGESHGACLVAILEGMPAGLSLEPRFIDGELRRRQLGYGRGARMTSIEVDRVEILSGLRRGTTIGSPIALRIANKDFSIDKLPVVTRPRPGHAHGGDRWLGRVFDHGARHPRSRAARARLLSRLAGLPRAGPAHGELSDCLR